MTRALSKVAPFASIPTTTHMSLGRHNRGFASTMTAASAFQAHNAAYIASELTGFKKLAADWVPFINEIANAIMCIHGKKGGADFISKLYREGGFSKLLIDFTALASMGHHASDESIRKTYYHGFLKFCTLVMYSFILPTVLIPKATGFAKSKFVNPNCGKAKLAQWAATLALIAALEVGFRVTYKFLVPFLENLLGMRPIEESGNNNQREMKSKTK